ncbi:hypothetical protein [Novosphingobium sp. AP12]|uniref:hypothetical protein n=1 Tax=Novosphingobium sp. AP12 TaxID=1144305 RepID=UPI000271E203|nr:hypothetical protein [Novosphingobium sp. AP12]EJL34459.1 hypothetical protein PMI02_00605 [Novosphingobium sp. AP12]
MLAHVPGNKVEGVYNRASYMDRRRELAAEWAELIRRPRFTSGSLSGMGTMERGSFSLGLSRTRHRRNSIGSAGG